jgi:putative transposase
MDASVRTRAEQLASEFAGQATTIEDLNGLMRLMMKSALERMLDTEMDVHLGRRSAPACDAASPPAAEPASPTQRPTNRRNGRSQKTVQGNQGELTIATPRDRAGTFEPQLIGKHQRRVPGFDEKILALYAKGMTTRDIQDIVRELYDVEISATLVSEITDDLDAEVTAWRTFNCLAVVRLRRMDADSRRVRSPAWRPARSLTLSARRTRGAVTLEANFATCVRRVFRGAK